LALLQVLLQVVAVVLALWVLLPLLGHCHLCSHSKRQLLLGLLKLELHVLVSLWVTGGKPPA
jgi:hypothetical protein